MITECKLCHKERTLDGGVCTYCRLKVQSKEVRGNEFAGKMPPSETKLATGVVEIRAVVKNQETVDALYGVIEELMVGSEANLALAKKLIEIAREITVEPA